MSQDQEVAISTLDPAESQAVEVITCLKALEASTKVSPVTPTSEVPISSETSINLNLIFEDDFDYTTSNHVSPTLLSISSPKHTSFPENELTGVQDQLVEISTSE